MHAAQEVLVTRVAPDGAEPQVHFQKNHPARVVRVGHLQVFQGLLLLFQPDMDFGHIVRRDVPLLGLLLQPDQWRTRSLFPGNDQI
jgi:hypothetical protein